MQKLACTLLVDDDQTTNFLCRRLLQEVNFTEKLLVAVNGQEALALLDEHCPPEHIGADCPVLILLDMKMPVMDGFDFLEAYARLPQARNPAIVIVMLTTSLHPRDLARAEQFNIAGFVSKPLTRAKINALLHTHFHRQFPTS
jgi:CheY-like chemotaxis protein